MPNYNNPKLRVKMLRTATLNNTAIDPGNLLIDMETHQIYFDVFGINDNAVRINITGGVHYMGSVPTEADLPSNAANGDMYNVTDTGSNYVWSAAENMWDKLGDTIDLTSYYTKTESDALFVSETNILALIDQLNAAI